MREAADTRQSQYLGRLAGDCSEVDESGNVVR